MSTTTTTPTAHPYRPNHPHWPYTPADFTRQNPAPDAAFYAAPRFTTHIDAAACAALTAYYARSLPRRGVVLDFCSSWVSHYPEELVVAEEEKGRGEKEGGEQRALRVVGVGMNAAELRANPALTAWAVRDLNEEPGFGGVAGAGDGEGELFDAATCVVSIDYLTQPREVLAALRRRTKTGGTVHLAISNRAFWEKTTRAWRARSEAERLEMVGDYLWFAGWREVEILTLTGEGSGEEGDDGKSGMGQGILRMLGMQGSDPLWIVRGTKVDDTKVDDGEAG